MRKLVTIVSCIAALAGVTAGSSSAASLGCGLPDTQTLWIEFADGSVDFRQQIFGRPGVVVATNGVPRAEEMRSLGAHTVYWHMFLRGLAGTPTAPQDPAIMTQRIDALIAKARASTGCDSPVVVFNELFGVSRVTPWPPEVVQYRQNVVTVFKTLADNGLKPVLLVPGQARGGRAPYVGDTAADWWREIARYGYIVREMHFNAPYIYAKGPILGARTRRVAMRDAIRALTDLGIGGDRLGLMLGFQSRPGKGGREQLQPTESWLQIVKQDTLAAKHVAAELGLATVISWGWGTFNLEGDDPDKPVAACVYLWTRDPSLCDALVAAGPEFNASMTEGQIILPAGVQCSVDADVISIAAFEQTIPLTGGDRAAALTALLNRVLYTRLGGTAPGGDVQAAERAVIDASFGGDVGAYEADLATRGVTRPAVLQAIADELRRQQANALFAVTRPGAIVATSLPRAQRDALRTMICLNDEVPAKRDLSWSSYLPFVALPDGSTTLTADKRVVKRGKEVTLSGTATGVRGREAVTVYARVGAGGFAEIGEAKADKSGAWSLVLVPEGPETTYVAVSKSAASEPVTVRVKSKKTKGDK